MSNFTRQDVAAILTGIAAGIGGTGVADAANADTVSTLVAGIVSAILGTHFWYRFKK
jgi:hypothetical protein